jgi:hypothetical protein
MLTQSELQDLEGCQRILGRGDRVPALGGALRFLGKWGVNGFVCGGLILKGAITATFISGQTLYKAGNSQDL